MTFFGGLSKVPASALYLGLAGLLPFWLPILAQLGGISGMSADKALLVQMAYGAIILSFLGGVRWGAALKLPRGPLQSTLFVFSVVPSLAGFTALLMPVTVGLLMLLGGFLVQGVWDVQSALRRQLPPWFAHLRTVLSVGAVLALLISLCLKFLAS